MSSGPSLAYLRALEEASFHHARSKTYSGKFLRPHKPFLSALIEQNGIESALDYGCGKGEQYRWVDPADGKTLEQFWGFEVAKYDPAWPPHAREPQGTFDLVICTHVLGGIPLIDHDWVLPRIFGHARKAVFIAEKIGPVNKAVHGKRRGMINGWTPDQWAAHIAEAAKRWVSRGNALPLICLSTLERIGEEKIMKRRIIL